MPAWIHKLSRIAPMLLRLILASGLCLPALPAWAEIQFVLPKYHLTADELAIVINEADPLSVRIGEYYRRARGIPEQNLIRVDFRPGASVMSREQFQVLKEAVDAQTPSSVQAFALTWVRPYRVDCQSITTAFTMGFDERYCAAKRCDLTHNSPYFNYPGSRPYQDLGIRPTMVIAATSFPQAKALIDRGIAADDSHPPGTAYLVSTADRARNVRHRLYPQVEKWLGNQLSIRIVDAPQGIRDRDDVLFYFTGVIRVPYLDSLQFRPGAMADHLTSAGGKMPESGQMSVLSWLEAGATGSYGTVLEPCNHLQKFPNPGIAIQHYLSGETLIEAYWKSVQQPGEGVFVGEPLARPFGGQETLSDGKDTLLRTRSLKPGRYAVLYSRSPIGPYRPLQQSLTVPFGAQELRFRNLQDGSYRLVPLSGLPAPGATP